MNANNPSTSCANPKVLVYKNGDELRPKVEDLMADNWKEFLFSDIFEKTFQLIKKEMLNPRKDKLGDRNNIIAFIGDRGSGKTSCLKSIYSKIDLLNSDITERKGIFIEYKADYMFYNKLPIIDPSYFDDHSNILELVVANMFLQFKKAASYPSTNSFTENGEENNSKLERKRSLVKCFQEVKDALDYVNQGGKVTNTNDSIESLSKMASNSNLMESIRTLVKKYLEYFYGDKKAMLVIAIDDLDVQARHTYRMLEQINKYLILDNVIILMGVKLVQLSHLLKKTFYNDFKIKEREEDSSIDDMVGRYLLKLLPLSHRFNLPNFDSQMDVDLSELDEGDLEKESISSAIVYLIYTRTDVSFYHTLEQESLIVPRNLREALNLIAFVSKLPALRKAENDLEREEREEQALRNRSVFRKYFVESWCLDKLTSKQYSFIEELVECDPVQVNKFIIDFLYSDEQYKKHLDDSENKEFLGIITKSNNRSYNISLGDVNYILDALSTMNDFKTKRFIFAIQTIYTFLLHDKFHEMKNDANHNAEILKELLTKGITISQRSNNTLNHICDYERLLGGNVISIYGESNKLLLAGCVNAASLYRLYYFLKENNDEDSRPTFKSFVELKNKYESDCQSEESNETTIKEIKNEIFKMIIDDLDTIMYDIKDSSPVIVGKLEDTNNQIQDINKQILDSSRQIEENEDSIKSYRGIAIPKVTQLDDEIRRIKKDRAALYKKRKELYILRDEQAVNINRLHEDTKELQSKNDAVQAYLDLDNREDDHDAENEIQTFFENKVKDFNVFEMFLLSMTYSDKEHSARLKKQCYYNSFPFSDLPSVGIVKFNFTAILYNIVRYYNLYIKYKYVTRMSPEPSPEPDLDKTLIDFFDIIMKLKNQSILYQLLDLGELEKKFGKDDNCDYSAIAYEHSIVKESFLQNISLLNFIEDHMTLLDAERGTNGNKNFSRIGQFFDRLSKFSFYTNSKNQSVKQIVSFERFKIVANKFNNNDLFKAKFLEIYNSDNSY